MTWTTEPELEGGEGREIVQGYMLIATVYNPTDAALIAAAPDLLAALDALLTATDGDIYTDAHEYADKLQNVFMAQSLAITAINKAKGT